MISMISLSVVIMVIVYFLNRDFFQRDAVITIVTSLPLGLFNKEENKSETKVTEQENNLNIVQKNIIEEPIGETSEEIQDNKLLEEEKVVVYWTPNGKNFHMTNNCKTLSRSKIIHSGNKDECEKSICCEQCKIKEEENKI